MLPSSAPCNGRRVEEAADREIVRRAWSKALAPVRLHRRGVERRRLAQERRQDTAELRVELLKPPAR